MAADTAAAEARSLREGEDADDGAIETAIMLVDSLNDDVASPEEFETSFEANLEEITED